MSCNSKNHSGTLGLFFILLAFIIIVQSCREKKVNTEKLIQEADSLYSGHQIESSLKLYYKAIEADNENIKALLMAGKVNYYTGKHTEAISLFERANKIQKNNLTILYWIAKTNSLDPEKKLKSLKQISEISDSVPSTIEMTYTRGVMEEETGMISQALKSFHSILQEENRIALTYLRLGRIYRTKKINSTADKYFQKAEILSRSNRELLEIIKHERSLLRKGPMQ